MSTNLYITMIVVILFNRTYIICSKCKKIYYHSQHLQLTEHLCNFYNWHITVANFFENIF